MSSGGLHIVSGFSQQDGWVEIDHTTAHFLRLLFKMDLLEHIVVSNITERMWDCDLLMEVDDIVGYKVWDLY
jgi:hypothetical protein